MNFEGKAGKYLYRTGTRLTPEKTRDTAISHAFLDFISCFRPPSFKYPCKFAPKEEGTCIHIPCHIF